MITIHFSSQWWIVVAILLFSVWFVYQDLISLSIEHSSVIVFLVVAMFIRGIGQLQGWFELFWLPNTLATYLVICVCIGFLCLRKWMGWGDFIVIAGLLLTLRQKDMIEMINFSFALASVFAVVMLIFNRIDRKSPLPFLPFLFMSYFFIIICDFCIIQ